MQPRGLGPGGTRGWSNGSDDARHEYMRVPHAMAHEVRVQMKGSLAVRAALGVFRRETHLVRDEEDRFSVVSCLSTFLVVLERAAGKLADGRPHATIFAGRERPDGELDVAWTR